MKKIIYAVIITAFLFAQNGCQKHELWNPYNPGAKVPAGTVAFSWYRLQLRFLLERNSTLNGAYFGYLGIGLYESVRHGIPNAISCSESLYEMPEMPAIENNRLYRWEISANAAMASMLKSYNVGLTTADLASIDSLESSLNQSLHFQASDESCLRSQNYGKSVAAAISAWSQTDNFKPSNAGYVYPVFDGSWVPTPPAFVNPPLNPYISMARPLLGSDLTYVAPPFPATYSEDPGSDFYKIVKNVYDVSHTLTADQKNIALFWVDQGNGLGYTPDGHNQLVVTEALEQSHANLAVAAEAYAKAGIAEREANIICFRAKYKYNLLRPVTYIRKLIDTAWSPLIVTPPFPEYPAAHAYVTGAVMQALAKVIGNNTSVIDHAYDFRGWPSRTYSSLFSVGEEAGISRLYGGIHYLTSINAGLSLGKTLGNSIGDVILTDRSQWDK